jgi:hypothetical protein
VIDVVNSDFRAAKRIAEGLLTAASSRSQISKMLKKSGFLSLGKGNWLGFKSDAVISGLKLEGSPSKTYVSSFILPLYDRNPFIHWSLGRRLLEIAPEKSLAQQVEIAIDHYREETLPVEEPTDLLAFLNKHNVDGGYAIWAAFVSLLKLKRLNDAQAFLIEEKKLELHDHQLRQYDEIRQGIEKADLHYIEDKLDEWHQYSHKQLKLPEMNFSLERSA